MLASRHEESRQLLNDNGPGCWSRLKSSYQKFEWNSICVSGQDYCDYMNNVAGKWLPVIPVIIVLQGTHAFINMYFAPGRLDSCLQEVMNVQTNTTGAMSEQAASALESLGWT